MKLKDFDFRLALTPEVMADIACDNKECPCQTPLLYGEQARNHLNDPLYKDCEVELWSGLYDKNGTKIYDGDIVKNLDSPDLYCVTLYAETGSGEFYVAYIKTPRKLCKECGERLHSIYYWGKYKDNRIECMEVVGNIHLRCEDEKTNL